MANQVEKIVVDVTLEAGSVDVSHVQKAIDEALAKLKASKIKVDIELVGGDITTLLASLEQLKQAKSSVKVDTQQVDQAISKAKELEKVVTETGTKTVTVKAPKAVLTDKAQARFAEFGGEDKSIGVRIKEIDRYVSSLQGAISSNVLNASDTKVNAVLEQQRIALAAVVAEREKLNILLAKAAELQASKNQLETTSQAKTKGVDEEVKATEKKLEAAKKALADKKAAETEAAKANQPVTIPKIATERFQQGTREAEALSTIIAETTKYESLLRTIIAANEVKLQTLKLTEVEEAKIKKELEAQYQILKSTVELRQQKKGTADSSLPNVQADTVALAKLKTELKGLEVEISKLSQTAPSPGESGYIKFLDKSIAKTEQLMGVKRALGIQDATLESSLSSLRASRVEAGDEKRLEATKLKIQEIVRSLDVLNRESVASGITVSVETREKAIQSLSLALEKAFIDLQKFTRGVDYLNSEAGNVVKKKLSGLLVGDSSADAEAGRLLNNLAKVQEATTNLEIRARNLKITQGNQGSFLSQIEILTNKAKELGANDATGDSKKKVDALVRQLEGIKEKVISVRLEVTGRESFFAELKRIEKEQKTFSEQSLIKDISITRQTQAFSSLGKEIESLILKLHLLEQAGEIGPSTSARVRQQLVAQKEVVSLREEEAKTIGKIKDAEAKAAVSALDSPSRRKNLEQTEGLLKNLELIQKRLELLGAASNSSGNLTTLNDTRLKLAEVTKEAEKARGAFAGFLGQVTKRVLVFPFFFQLRSALFGAVKEIVDFEKELVNIQAVAAATDNQMRSVAQTILTIGERSKFTTLEIANAATTLIQAGTGTEKLAATLKSVEQLASATGSGIQETANLTTTFLAVFDDANPLDIADSLKAAVNISKLNVQDLNTISNYLLSTGKSYNENFKDVLAVSATLKNAGLKASTIATNSRQALLELLSPDTKALKGLVARYKTIGEDMSEQTVRALFQGFKAAKDPLKAALDELQRLGIGELGSKELSRIFDIRSENVIKTLVQNKDALAANRVLLDDAGSAAEGAKVQMESLSTSLQNLREVLVAGIFDASISGIKDLGKFTREATENIAALLKKMAEYKKATGSSGVGAIVGPALAAGGAAVARGGGIRQAATAAVVGGTAGALALEGASAETADKVTTAATVFGLGITAFSLLKKTFGVVATGVGGLVGKAKSFLTVAEGVGAAAGTAGVAGELVAAGGVWASVKLLFSVSPWGRVASIIAQIGGLLFLAYETLQPIFSAEKTIAEARASAENKLAAGQKLIEESKNKIAELKAQQDKASETAKVGKEFQDRVKSLNEAIELVAQNSTSSVGAIADAIKGSGKVSAQLGSKTLTDLAAKLGVNNQRVLAELIQNANEAVAIADAFREQILKRRHVALSNVVSGTATKSDKESVSAFEALSAEDRAALQKQVISPDEVKKILDIKLALDGAFDVGSVDSIAEKIKGEEANIAKEAGDQVTALLESLMSSNDPLVLPQIKDMVDTAVEEGSVAVVQAMVDASQGYISDVKVKAAEAVAKSKATAEFEKAIASFAKTDAAPTPLLTLDDLEKGIVKAKVERNVGNLEAEIAGLRTTLVGLQKSGEDAIAAGASVKEVGAFTKQINDKGKELASKVERLNQLKSVEVEGALTATELERSLILNNQQIADAGHKLKIMQDSKVTHTEEELKLIQQTAKLKGEALEAEKKSLAHQLAVLLKEEQNIGAEGDSPERLLSALASAQGQKIVIGSEAIGKAYKELLRVTDQETSLRAETAKDLERMLVEDNRKKQAELDRSLILNNQKIAQATHQLSILQAHKVAHSEEEIALILETNKLKRRALEAEKQQLSQFLRAILKDADPSFKTASPEQILNKLNSEQGQKLVTGSEEVSGAYQKLLKVVDQESNLREEVLKDLANVAVEAARKKKASQETEIARLKNVQEVKEAALESASQNLADARQRLADALNNQQGLEDFFAGLSTAGPGNSRQQLQGAQDRAFFNPQDIEAQKNLAQVAAELARSGTIGKSQADSIIEDARRAAQQVQQQNVEQASSDVIRAQNNEMAAFNEAVSARKSTQTLVESNLKLDESINNLSSTLQSTIGALQSSGVATQIPQDIQKYLQNPVDVSKEVQTGVDKSAQEAMQPTVFKFFDGMYSADGFMSQNQIDRLAKDMNDEARKKTLN